MSPLFLRRLAATAGAAIVAFGALGAAPAQAEPNDDFPWDLTIPAVTVTGAVGDVVPVTMTVRNLGPAAVEPGRVRAPFIQRPSGTEFTGDVSAECNGKIQPDRYYCQTPDGLAVGAEKTWTFHLKLTDAHPGRDGFMFFADGGHEDRDVSNDSGSITVVIKTPETGPTTAAPTATPSRTAGPAPSTSAVAGPALPVTGDRTALYAGLGAALVAAGAVLFVIARRRRVVMVTPDA
ncbi:LPXTG cell wall anchor domain-containing protein [Dactylosporangium sp. CA-052675]|uniref:LPXTG cell wall anchor domain-containing protein n=1 Tax=Dactylosporangium sp. CA-052675 TaxID=3239927 RepID=UPI003D8F73CF